MLECEKNKMFQSFLAKIVQENYLGFVYFNLFFIQQNAEILRKNGRKGYTNLSNKKASKKLDLFRKLTVFLFEKNSAGCC